MLQPAAVFFVALAVAWSDASAQAAQQSVTNRPLSLPQEFIEAQQAQQRNDVPSARRAYRAFLAHALAELAEADVVAGDDPHSTQRMNDALALSREDDLLLQAARLFLLAGENARASEIATEVVQRAPAQKELLAGAHQVLGRVLLKQQRDQDARKEFELATALDPTFLNGYDLAVACLDLGDEPCATKIFTEMEQSFHDSAELHVAFGKAYGNSDFQPKAIYEFQRAIAEDPRRPGVHYLLAAVLLANGGDESARVSAEKELLAELRISPNDALTYATLGQIELIRKDYPKAEEYLKQAIQFGPQLPEGYLYIGQVYFNTGKTDEAEQSLRRCIELTKDPSRNRYQVQKAHYLLGRILSRKGQPQESLAELNLSRELADKALALDKSRLAGVMDTAHAPAVQVEIPDAAESTSAAAEPRDPRALEQAQKLEADLRPALAEAYNNLGIIALAQNDFDESAEDFRHAAAWDPKLDGLDFHWGLAAFSASRYAEAIGPLSRYVSAHSDDAGARSVLAISEFKTGNFQGCINALRPVDGKAELAPEVAYIYADSLLKTGAVEEATQRLTALAKAYPDAPEIQSALTEAKGLRKASHP